MMKTYTQQRTDERDNKRVLRWAVIAIVVLVLGALTYNYFGRERTGDAPAAPPTTQAPQNSAAPAK